MSLDIQEPPPLPQRNRNSGGNWKSNNQSRSSSFRQINVHSMLSSPADDYDVIGPPIRRVRGKSSALKSTFDSSSLQPCKLSTSFFSTPPLLNSESVHFSRDHVDYLEEMHHCALPQNKQQSHSIISTGPFASQSATASPACRLRRVLCGAALKVREPAIGLACLLGRRRRFRRKDRKFDENPECSFDKNQCGLESSLPQINRTVCRVTSLSPRPHFKQVRDHNTASLDPPPLRAWVRVFYPHTVSPELAHRVDPRVLLRREEQSMEPTECKASSSVPLNRRLNTSGSSVEELAQLQEDCNQPVLSNWRPNQRALDLSAEPTVSQCPVSLHGCLESSVVTCFRSNLVQLRAMGCYWGPLTVGEAQTLLSGRPDGTFLLRDSEHETHLLSASFTSGYRVFHARIQQDKAGQFCLARQEQVGGPRAARIDDFVYELVRRSRRGDHSFLLLDTDHSCAALASTEAGNRLMQLPVSLVHPLSRKSFVPTLQHLCRFEIMSRVRRDLVTKLRVPPSVKDFLLDRQWYADMSSANAARAVELQIP